jgi:KDO2-lipid IV(A) lauroyltransferase
MKKKIVFSFLFLTSLLPLFFFRYILTFFLSKGIKSSKDYLCLKKNIKKVLCFDEYSKNFSYLVSDNLRHFSLVLGESLKVAFLGKKIKILSEEKTCALLEKTQEDGGGSFVLVTAHLGAWDLLGNFYQEKTKDSCYALAKPSRSSFMQIFLEIFRKKLRIKLLWTGKANFQREVLSVLAQGSSVIFLVDQKPHKSLGVPINFMGYKTEFVKGPAYLAKKYKKPLLVSFLLRRENFVYEMVSNLIDKDTVENLSLEELTQKYSNIMETVIKKNPEQWVWSYKRWSD